MGSINTSMNRQDTVTSNYAQTFHLFFSGPQIKKKKKKKINGPLEEHERIEKKLSFIEAIEVLSGSGSVNIGLRVHPGDESF